MTEGGKTDLAVGLFLLAMIVVAAVMWWLT